jgi:hypothetical protein
LKATSNKFLSGAAAILRLAFRPTRWTAVALLILASLWLDAAFVGHEGTLPVSASAVKIIHSFVTFILLAYSLPLGVMLVAQRAPLREVGLDPRRLHIALGISLVGAAVALLLQLRSMGVEGDLSAQWEQVLLLLSLNKTNVSIFLCLQLENLCMVFFFWVFLRRELENAFGFLVSFLGTAVGVGIWGLLAMGTSRFFVVGLAWAVLVRLTHSPFVVFPFWIGAASAYQVLVFVTPGAYRDRLLDPHSAEGSAGGLRFALQVALILAVTVAFALWRRSRTKT